MSQILMPSGRRAAIADACIKDSVEAAFLPKWGSVGADPRLEFRLEDGLRRPTDRARECVEVSEALPVLQRVLLQLPDPFADDRVRRGVARSDDLMRREQLDALKHGKDRKSTRLNSSHVRISHAGFCLHNKNAQQR